MRIRLAVYHVTRKIREVVQTRILQVNVGRQRYPLGTVPAVNLYPLWSYFIYSLSYQDNYLAYVDKDEYFSIRALREYNSLQYQIHLRGYTDGEIRGHFEITPEEDWREHKDGTTMREIPEPDLSLIATAIQKYK